MFHSLLFKNENSEKYKQVLEDNNGDTIQDNLGRIHLLTPYSGPVHLKLRSNKYHHSTIVTHVTDLYKILQERINTTNRNCFMTLSDGGPDFTPASVVNMLYFFRLFKRLKLDLFSVFTYAARYSAFNAMEHVWSPLSNKLAGVLFNPKVEGESKAPCQQSGLSAESLKEKEFVVFDNAIDDLSKYWNNATFDGYDVHIEKILCGNDAVFSFSRTLLRTR